MWLYQGPNLFNEYRVPFAAMAFNEIFQLPVFQKQLDSLDLSKLQYQFAMKKMASPIVVTLPIDDSTQITDIRQKYRSYLDSLAMGKLVTNFMLDTVKTQLKKRMTTTGVGPKRYQLLRDYWVWNEEKWINTVQDSIEQIKLTYIQRFVQEYLIDAHYASVLLLPDSSYIKEYEEDYTNTTFHLRDYVFSFNKNTGDMDSSSQLLNSLYQWLKINPQMTIQVVGYAGKDELNQVQDDEMLDFLEAHPDFKITQQSLIPTRKIRLDVYRALVVTRYLLDRGIPDSQVSGNGITLPSDFKTETDRRKAFLIRTY